MDSGCLWDLFTAPFELITGSVECLFSCLFVMMILACIGVGVMTVLLLQSEGIIGGLVF